MAKHSKPSKKAKLTKDYTDACVHKIEEAKFFLDKLEQSLNPGTTPSSQAELETRYYASAFLGAVRGPVNLFLNRNTINYKRRQNWHRSNIKGLKSVKALGELRDFNVHVDRVPEVIHFVKKFDYDYSQTLDPLHGNKSVMDIFRDGLAETPAYIEAVKKSGLL